MAGCGCGWRGLNSVAAAGHRRAAGPGSYQSRRNCPTWHQLEQNSRVRVGDVTVGTVTKIERQGWHALMTMRLNGDVDLPANATAKIGQTSLLGSLHVELAPPTDVPPQGRLHDGSLIPLSSARAATRRTEQTLSAASLLLNGGGIGQIQDITKALSTAFAGRENDLRSLIEQLDKFIGHLNDQKDDIIAATDSLNNLVGQFAATKAGGGQGVTDHPRCVGRAQGAAQTTSSDALDQLGKFSALAADSVNQTKDSSGARS